MIKNLKINHIEILINLVDQDISNYKSVLERTKKQTWQDKIDVRLEIRKELYNQLIMSWYMTGFRDELSGSSSVMPDDKILEKAYSIGAGDAIIGDDVSSVDQKTEDEIIRQIISNE